MKNITTIILIISITLLTSGCDQFDKSKAFEKVENQSTKKTSLEKKQAPVTTNKKNASNSKQKEEKVKQVNPLVNKDNVVDTVVGKNKNDNPSVKPNNSYKPTSPVISEASKSAISFNIDIDENNKELVDAVEELKQNYEDKILTINKFYSDKKNELENNFQKKVDDAKHNLLSLVKKFEEKCKVFTSKNITHCKSLKQTIEESRNIIDKGDYELKIMREKMIESQEKELASEQVLFQKSILNLKNSFIYK